MSQALKAKSKNFFPEIVHLLQAGKKVEIRVTGNSMFPFLRHGVHVVQLVSVEYAEIRQGDIVLIQRSSGVFILHRVVKLKCDCFFISGDAETKVEGPIAPNQLVAVVCGVKKRNKIYTSADLRWKLHKIFYQKRSFPRKVVIKLFSHFCRYISSV